MLYEVLKVLTYVSIITTTTSSGFLTKESLVNYRRASPSSTFNGEPAQLSNDGEGFERTDLSNDESSKSESDYLIPQIVNVKMLYTQLNNANNKNSKKSNSRKLSQKMRGKKDNNNKLINSKNNKLTNLIKNYDNLNKGNNVASSYSVDSNNVRNFTDNFRKEENNKELNQTNSGAYAPGLSFPDSSTFTNEYPVNKLPLKTEDRELQQLFGFEGAKKYQNYQLQQQLLNDNEDYPIKPNDEGVEVKAPHKKRSGDNTGEEIQDVSGALVNQMMPRTTRRQREYDVPLIRE